MFVVLSFSETELRGTEWEESVTASSLRKSQPVDVLRGLEDFIYPSKCCFVKF